MTEMGNDPIKSQKSGMSTTSVIRFSLIVLTAYSSHHGSTKFRSPSAYCSESALSWVLIHLNGMHLTKMIGCHRVRGQAISMSLSKHSHQ